MKVKFFKYLTALALATVICLPQVAAADLILNFDDVATSSGKAVLPDNYGGFTWTENGYSGDKWGVVDNAYYRQYYNNTFDFPSNPNVVNNTSITGLGVPEVTISSSTPFNFVGASFGTWTYLNTNNYLGATSLTLTGKQGDTVVGTATFNLTPGGLIWHELDFQNIDTLIITATGSVAQNFLMDNFTYSSSHSSSQVPLPSTLLLLGSGVLGLTLLRRREKRHT